MRLLVVFFAACAVACGSVVPLVAHSAPLIATAPIVNYIGGSAVSHQSRVDVHSSPAVVSHSVVAPVVSAHSAWASPALSGYSGWATPAIAAHGLGLSAHGLGLSAHGLGLGGHSLGLGGYGLGYSGHLLKKRSLGQDLVVTRVLSDDDCDTPTITTNGLGLGHGLVVSGRTLGLGHSLGYSGYSGHRFGLTGHSLGLSGRTVLAHRVGLSKHGVRLSHGLGGYDSWLALSGHGHILKKRSLGLVNEAIVATPLISHAIAATPIVKYIGGSSLSHQSRVDVHSSPAIVSHSVVAPVISAYSGWQAPAIASHSLGLSAHGLGYGGHGLGLLGYDDC